MRRASFAIACLIALLPHDAWISAAGVPAADIDKWWNPAWRFRRTLAIQGQRQGYVAERLATFGRTSAEEADIAVIAGDQTRVPHVILDAGREDSVLISFLVRDPKLTYRIYFGNPTVKASTGARSPAGLPALRPQDIPKAGLFYEVRKLGSGTTENWKEMQQLIAASPEVLGRDLLPRPTLGVNPFGADENYIIIIHGVLRIADAGKWKFATNSNGPSFLLVNDKVVASWPGWHGVEGSGAMGEHSGEITLKRAAYRFTYAFAARGGKSGCVAGIQGPRDLALRPLEARDFVPFLAATAGPVEELALPDIIDFEWQPTNDFGLAGRDACLVRFTDRSSFPNRTIAAWNWRFGDGQTGSGKAIEHCFLERGTYLVELNLVLAGDTIVRNAARVAVNPRGHHGADVEPYVTASLPYDLKKLSEGALKNLVFFRWEDGRDDLKHFYGAAATLFQMKPKLDGGELETFAEAYLDEIFFKDAPETVAVAEYLLGEAKREPLRIGAALAAGATYAHILGKKEEAERVLKVALGAGSKARERLLTLLLSDLYRVEGKKADAQDLLVRGLAMHEQVAERELSRGECMYRIRHQVAAKEFGKAWEVLNEWLAVEPEALIEGEISFFRAEILAAAGHSKPALDELERILGEKETPRRPIRRKECLTRAVDLYKILGMTEKAAAATKLLEDEFPPSKEPAEGQKG